MKSKLMIVFLAFSMSAFCQAPTNGLIGYWPFSGNANDASGNNHNGTVSGATLSANRFGQPNSAYEFNGIDNYINFDSIINIPNQPAITLSAWFYVDTIATPSSYVGLGFGEKITGSVLLRIRTGSDKRFQTLVADANEVNMNSTLSSNFSYRNWYHLVGIFDNTQTVFYLNNVLQSTVVNTGTGGKLTAIPGNSKFRVGVGYGNMNAATYFDGRIDDVRIYNRALTSGEISLLYGESTTPETTDTVIHVNVLMNINRNAVRIAKNSIDNSLYYITGTGNLYKILKDGNVYSDSLVVTAATHNINSLQGLAFKDSIIFLAGNRKASQVQGYGLVVRGKMQANNSWLWDTIMKTVPYPSSFTLYDHQINGICLSLNGDSLYINSGSRTDHGEEETAGGLYPGTRDVPLTVKMFKIPVNPVSTILLNNDSATIAASPYLFCSGVRNSFDQAFAPNGDLFATENSGDRDDPEELNWLRKGKHYGFPWRMGGDTTPMQFPGYIPADDKLINHKSLGWGNGTTTNKFYNDPGFPSIPGGTVFTEPVINYGPDADKFRDNAGAVHDASNEGKYITSFSSHRSPLGLVFDFDGKMDAPYNYSAFVLSYTQGSIDTTGIIVNSTGPFSDESQDMLQLALYKDPVSSEYSMNCYRIAYNFNKPVDAFIDNNVIYIIESHTPNDFAIPRLYSLTFPPNAGGKADFLGKDSTICNGTGITINPKLKGKFNYLWSNGATTSQISVAPTSTIDYRLTISNGVVTLRDTIRITVVMNPSIPGSISTSGGNVKVCPGEIRSYTVNNATGINYIWTVPPGAVINSGQGTNSINVTYINGFTANGVLSIRASNICGISATRNLTITRNTPATPGALTGLNYGLCGASNQSYSVTAVAGMVYSWTTPPGINILNGQGSNSINVNFPSSNFAGNISVTASNACGSSAARNLTVRATPATPASISGPVTACANQQNVAYSIVPIPSANSYTWGVPSGGSVTTGQGSNAITMKFGTASGNVRVRAQNGCGVGSYKTLAVTINCRSTSEQLSDDDFTIYPNPTTGHFILAGTSLINQVKITNVTGQVIYYEKTNAKSIQVHLTKGIYYVTVSTTEGNRTKMLMATE